MKECTATTTFTVTKRELLIDSVDTFVMASMGSLKNKIGKDFVNMILADFKDVDNNFQFELTIRKLENSEI